MPALRAPDGRRHQTDDDHQVSITAPDADTVMDIEESRSSRRTLELLTWWTTSGRRRLRRGGRRASSH
jgi:hypothetical protein